MVIQVDSRENKNKNVLDYFDSVGQKYIVSKMISGDYQDVNSIDVLIDLKQSHGDGLAELCANMTRTTTHERFKREIERAGQIGCKKFIVLIVSKNAVRIDDIHLWENKHGKVKPETFQKIVQTFADRYNVEFIFCKKQEAGKKILELLQNN